MSIYRDIYSALDLRMETDRQRASGWLSVSKTTTGFVDACGYAGETCLIYTVGRVTGNSVQRRDGRTEGRERARIVWEGR